MCESYTANKKGAANKRWHLNESTLQLEQSDVLAQR